MGIFGKGKCKLIANCANFWQGKCKFIANFSATMVTSLPSLSLSVCLYLSLSLSHRMYLTHNIGSASALPIIFRFSSVFHCSIMFRCNANFSRTFSLALASTREFVNVFFQQIILLETSPCTKRLFYMAIIAADIEYGSNAFYSSLSTSSKEKLIRLSKRGVRAIFRAPPWTPSLPLYQQLQICRRPQRMDYKLLVFTYLCTHSLTSTLLTSEFSVLGQSNARTRSITRGQSCIFLSLPNVCHRSGTISPLFTCSLLWNSLPSSLRHPDVDFSRFRNALATYMGFPVTGHTKPVGFPNKNINQSIKSQSPPLFFENHFFPSMPFPLFFPLV